MGTEEGDNKLLADPMTSRIVIAGMAATAHLTISTTIDRNDTLLESSFGRSRSP